MIIVLIGPRGCGKSTVGQLLAARLGYQFVDLDDHVAGLFEEATIAEIWSAHGESAWRAAELCMFKSLLATTDADRVVSLGGGVPMIPEVQEMLTKNKPVGMYIYYLKCRVTVLAKRLLDSPGDRPSIISGLSVVEELEPILAKREPIYESLADDVIDGSTASEHVTETILETLKNRDQ